MCMWRSYFRLCSPPIVLWLIRHHRPCNLPNIATWKPNCRSFSFVDRFLGLFKSKEEPSFGWVIHRTRRWLWFVRVVYVYNIYTYILKRLNRAENIVIWRRGTRYLSFDKSNNVAICFYKRGYSSRHRFYQSQSGHKEVPLVDNVLIPVFVVHKGRHTCPICCPSAALVDSPLFLSLLG